MRTRKEGRTEYLASGGVTEGKRVIGTATTIPSYLPLPSPPFLPLLPSFFPSLIQGATRALPYKSFLPSVPSFFPSCTSFLPFFFTSFIHSLPFSVSFVVVPLVPSFFHHLPFRLVSSPLPLFYISFSFPPLPNLPSSLLPYMYIYIYIYTYTNTHTHTHTHIYIYIYLFVCAWVNLCNMHIHCVCVCVCSLIPPDTSSHFVLHSFLNTLSSLTSFLPSFI